LSGPSGAGKGTVCRALRKMAPELVYSVSATTRSPRAGEVDGIDYFFKSKQQFLEMIKNEELLEWAEYVGNYYGTPAEFVQRSLDAGKDVILEIEVQGAMKVKEKHPDGVFIFLIPPSLSELKNRIESRGTEPADVIKNRLSVAREEIKLAEHYDYAVVNERIETACQQILAIIQAEHCKPQRVLPAIHERILNEVK